MNHRGQTPHSATPASEPDDLFTLIYTSGTTGAPKGVMLMHSNMLFQINNLPIQISTEDRILSILPVWHIFERVFEIITGRDATEVVS